LGGGRGGLAVGAAAAIATAAATAVAATAAVDPAGRVDVARLGVGVTDRAGDQEQ
jgi:hypothetical protein